MKHIHHSVPRHCSQGYTEQSNVNVIKEMVDMITITRAYEANQKVIRSYDTMLDRAANQVGRLQG